MKNISDVVNSKKCTGCSACLNVCSYGAIRMQFGKEGFLSPVIDDKRCVGCGLCDRVCPTLNDLSRKNQFLIPKVYAGWNKNEKIRMRSSSGGVFSALAEYFIKNKGYVCGAAFDKKNHLRHIIISNENDLEKLRGSKYLQSEVGDVYKKIKVLLNKNKCVLFSGTPCQVAGLRSFLGKDYERLLVVDLVCHGVPSSKVFRTYINEVEKNKKFKVSQINFRDKSTGWKNSSFVLSNGKKDTLRQSFYENIFLNGFLKNLFLNKICTNCLFSKFPKYSDITLGDYWGIWDYKKDLDDDRGVSVVIINNQKGLNFLNLIIKIKKMFLEEVEKEEVLKKLFSIYLPCQIHPNRKEFFSGFDNLNISKKINKNLCQNIGFNKKNVAILNMRFPTNNYGAILQSFALSEVIKRLGYKPKVINYISNELDNNRDKISLLSLDKFREEKIEYTLPCYNEEDLIKLNRYFGIFVVGSDQVWNYNYLNWTFKEDIARYFLNFSSSVKNIFSYAASFAEDNWNGNEDEIGNVKEALKRFSTVSVREKSGVGICKNLFGVEAFCVLDPTLLLDKYEYQKIIDSENIKQNKDNYLAYFTLNENLEKNILGDKKLKKIIDNKKWQLKNIRGFDEKVLGKNKFIYNSVPNWLSYVKNSEFIITDSYHCVIFSIIFKKQFLVIQRDYAGNGRLSSLFSILGIKNIFFKSIDEMDYDMVLNYKIDYDDVYKKLEKEKEKSMEFLKNSLKKTKSDKEKLEKSDEEFVNLKINIFSIKSKNKILQNEIEKCEEQKNVYEEKLREAEFKNESLQTDLKQLDLAIKAYRETKTYRYAKKIKKILLKLGVKKFKL